MDVLAASCHHQGHAGSKTFFAPTKSSVLNGDAG